MQQWLVPMWVTYSEFNESFGWKAMPWTVPLGTRYSKHTHTQEYASNPKFKKAQRKFMRDCNEPMHLDVNITFQHSHQKSLENAYLLSTSKINHHVLIIQSFKQLAHLPNMFSLRVTSHFSLFFRFLACPFSFSDAVIFLLYIFSVVKIEDIESRSRLLYCCPKTIISNVHFMIICVLHFENTYDYDIQN